MAGRLVDFSSALPLGSFEMEPIGWDRPTFRLGRASWNFKRDGLALHASYRNLEQEQSWELGALSSATTDDEILSWVAAQSDSHSPSDWVRIDNRILSFTFDRGEA